MPTRKSRHILDAVASRADAMPAASNAAISSRPAALVAKSKHGIAMNFRISPPASVMAGTTWVEVNVQKFEGPLRECDLTGP